MKLLRQAINEAEKMFAEISIKEHKNSSVIARLLRNGENYFSNSQGFKPVCFLNAAEKCEMDE